MRNSMTTTKTTKRRNDRNHGNGHHGSNTSSIMDNDGSAKDTNNDGLLTSQQALRRLLDDTFPHQEEIVYAFGYGSGVLAQEQTAANGGGLTNNNNNSDKMVDLIVVVRDSLEFHKANFQANPSHYWIPPAPVRVLAPSWNNNNNNNKGASSSSSSIAQWCTWWQRHDAPFSSWLQNPGVYYNIVDAHRQLQPSLKYGVVQVDDLVDDLREWKYLYLAGRMHKPIVTILNRQEDDNGISNNSRTDGVGSSLLSISQAQQDNLMAALSTSLLLLSKPPSSQSSSAPLSIPSAVLFRQVAALSYSGDFRMSIAEDPKKIDKLVQGSGSAGQLQRFESLYRHVASQLVQSGVLSIDKMSSSSSTTTDCTNDIPNSSSMVWSWDASSPTARQLLWSKLPMRLRQQQPHDSSTIVNHHHQRDSVEWLSQQLASTVAPAARYQSFKGIVTAGPRKAWVYAARKIAKRVLPK